MAKPAPLPPPEPLNPSAIGAVGSDQELQSAPVDVAPQKVSFMRSPWVQDVLPLATSIFLHIGVILIGFGTYEVAKKVVQVVKEQVIIPDSTMVDGAEAGGIPNPGLGGDPTRRAEQDVDPNVKDSEGWSDKPSASLEASLMAGGAADGTDGTIGIGGATSFGRGDGKRVGSGTGDGGGPMAPFGVPGGGGGIGPKSNFMGVGGNARKIVYLCDASGSMLSVFSSLKVELKKSVDLLKTVQAFNVIFFQDDTFESLNKGGLVMANADNKRKCYEFVEERSSSGTTNPMPAIEDAFKQKPELMYVLTDGFDAIADFDELLKTFRRLNADKKVKVNCIFLRSGDQPELEEILRTIARENGGVLKIIEKSDM